MNAANQNKEAEKVENSFLLQEETVDFSEMQKVLENGLNRLQNGRFSPTENHPFEIFLKKQSELLLRQARHKVNRTTRKQPTHFSMNQTFSVVYKWLVFNLFGHGMRESLATWQVR